mmetsp:Transcript_17965/g.39833  ORF Transcript_17965/g.39833 Transcript_17965/m.39833 type:complete len:232 (+) Transcript_17965:862-1557(+)
MAYNPTSTFLHSVWPLPPASKPNEVARKSAWASVTPTLMSIGCLKMSSGVAAATSSIEVPPAGDAMKIGPPAPRSSMIDTYISLRMYMRSPSITLVQGRPAAPVCLVISCAPSMLDAKRLTSPSLAHMCTPPWKPLSKWPRPRPPVRTMALITQSFPSPMTSLYFFSASSTLVAMAVFGTGMPKPRIISIATYSWTFSSLAPPMAGVPRSRAPLLAPTFAADLARRFIAKE